jgi:hypothetical protein
MHQSVNNEKKRFEIFGPKISSLAKRVAGDDADSDEVFFVDVSACQIFDV